VIRRRRPDDLPALVELLRVVHEVDGYPVWWPEGPERFVAPDYEEAAWVAEVDGEVVGHVGRHRATQDPGFSLAHAATDERLVSIGRLFTSPDHRGDGLAGALLASAVDGPERPFLNVVRGSPAVGLYEHLGWQRLGATRITLPTGVDLQLEVFLGPQTRRPRNR
jgi:GNAT superfamily N-acetyltransferase